jgi:hypothetical protein
MVFVAFPPHVAGSILLSTNSTGSSGAIRERLQRLSSAVKFTHHLLEPRRFLDYYIDQNHTKNRERDDSIHDS